MHNTDVLPELERSTFSLLVPGHAHSNFSEICVPFLQFCEFCSTLWFWTTQAVQRGKLITFWYNGVRKIDVINGWLVRRSVYRAPVWLKCQCTEWLSVQCRKCFGFPKNRGRKSSIYKWWLQNLPKCPHRLERQFPTPVTPTDRNGRSSTGNNILNIGN